MRGPRRAAECSNPPNRRPFHHETSCPTDAREVVRRGARRARARLPAAVRGAGGRGAGLAASARLETLRACGRVGGLVAGRCVPCTQGSTPARGQLRAGRGGRCSRSCAVPPAPCSTLGRPGRRGGGAERRVARSRRRKRSFHGGRGGRVGRPHSCDCGRPLTPPEAGCSVSSGGAVIDRVRALRLRCGAAGR